MVLIRESGLLPDDSAGVLIDSSSGGSSLSSMKKYFEDLEPMLDIIAVGLMKSVEFIIQSFEDSKENQQTKKPFHLTEKG